MTRLPKFVVILAGLSCFCSGVNLRSLEARQASVQALAPGREANSVSSDEAEAAAILRRLPRRPVEISLHRGANRYAPENTMPAFEKALRLGADYIEFDVRATADGEFFLLHDSRLDRTTDGTGPIREKTAADVRKLSAGVKFAPEYAQVRVPSLDEFLETFAPKVGLYFDAKAIPPEALADALRKHDAIKHTVVYQSAEYLQKLKQINPSIRALAPLEKPEDLDHLIATLKPYAVDADWNILSKDLIARCHNAGIRVFSDALGEHETVKDYLQAMDWGIDLIQTDYPLRVLQAMELRMTTSAGISYPLEVLPPEARQMTDPQTGADLLFLTTNPADDQNLYYEQRSWLADSSLILFNSTRTNGGLMGFLTKTKELVRFSTAKGGLGGATAAGTRNSVFAMRGADVLELSLRIEPSNDPARSPSKVTASERVICTLPNDYLPPNTSLSENADGTLLAVGVGGRGNWNTNTQGRVITIDTRTGKVSEITHVPATNFAGHVVFSRTNPDLVSFAQSECWIEVMDVRKKESVFRHKKVEGEFCTHHCWWLGDTITFTGGFHPQPTEDSDLKAIDIRTGITRIIGKGSWWPGATSSELGKNNWWHACGSEVGRWLVADNWHGDIGIFHAKTTRTYVLTRGHRTYGHGTHPEVGWDRKGEQVIFASYMLGDLNVCVATIPKAWQEAWASQCSVESGEAR